LNNHSSKIRDLPQNEPELKVMSIDSRLAAFARLPRDIKDYTLFHYTYIALARAVFFLKGGTRFKQKFYNAALNNALHAAIKNTRPTDISDHLGTIFYFTVDARPRLIVELGTRGGESTRALLSAATLTGSTLLSVDIEDCSKLELPFMESWRFVRSDDIEFGMNGFRQWCAENGHDAVVDVLYVDTSHLYEHSKREIEVWSRFLADNGTMIFHDTNMGTGPYARTDGSIGSGWNNERGVIRAIEEFLGRKYDESAYFSDVTNLYNVLHFPSCSGLTIIKRHKK
jgi:hypothetical protein